MVFKRLIRLLMSYFVRGILFTIPLTVIIYSAVRLFGWMDSMLPTKIPGIGIVLLILLITSIGYLGSTFIADPVKRSFLRTLDRIPLLKTVYTAIKDLLVTVVGKKKKFNQPVRVRISNDTEIERLGFIVQEDLKDIGVSRDKVAVYFPFSYSLSGRLVIVPAVNVTPIDARPADVMKFIVSGGMSKIQEEEKTK